MDPPHAAAAPPPVHDAAFRLSSVFPAGSALDVPCGTGLLAKRLLAAGWRVTGGDRDPEPARAAGIDARRIDLEMGLPFPDGSFDLVLCVEGIEHIENQALLLREAARVLRPRGGIVLSTPNVLGRPSRTSLHRHGYARFFRPLPAGRPTPYEHEHRHPIDVVRLDFLLREAGLVPEAFDCERGPDGAPSPRRRWLRRLSAPGLRARNPRADLLLLPPVYFGRILAVRARKA